MTDDTANNVPQPASNGQSNALHLRQKRARSQLSCIPCRNGKLKCNRVHEPACDQCIKRNREGQCIWVPPPTKQKAATQNVKGRIRQLESLVVDLMNQQSGNGNGNSTRSERKDSTGTSRSAGEPTPPSSDENDSLPRRDEIECTTKPFGQMRISKNEISYVGETHWKAILNGISSLKRDLEDEEEATQGEDDNSADAPTDAWRNDQHEVYPGWEEQAHSTNGLGFMLGSSDKVTREQLIAAVPEKKVADRLLSLWFNSPDPFKPILHAPTFQEEYRSFLRDPTQTSTMWIGLLFAILSLAASFGLRDCAPNSPTTQKVLAEVNKYHTLAASAAVLADFTKPKQYTIECLLLYGAGLRSNDAFVNVWIMIGLCVRLALRMGYHRDSSNYPAISAFQGEMRRRVWATISMIDVLISFQLALPSMVKTVVADTQPPRNLLDRDFNINTKVLPPSRGIDELTPSSYTRAKLRVVNIFAEAAELSHATIPPSHDEMMELDRKLEEAKAQLPPLLQMPDISELVTDPAEQLMCRFNLDLLYLKTKTVLHRRYMETPFSQLPPQEQRAGIGLSRKIAVDCALRVLQHHHTIYTASQAGGQLESVKWYMGSISTHDFLLAAMVICLELSQQISQSVVLSPAAEQCPKRNALMEALERSQQIWESSGRRKRSTRFQAQDANITSEHMFDETEKAAIAMGVMLRKVKQRFPAQAPLDEQRDFSMSRSSPFPPHNNTLPFGGIVSNHPWDNVPDNILPENLDFSNLASIQSNSSNVQPTPSNDSFSMVNSNQNSTPEQLDYLGNMLDTSGTIDWNMFDTGVNQGPGHQEVQQFSNSPDALADMLRMPVAGNALMGNGTGPGSGSYPAGWMSFQDMDDVSFNVGSDYVFDTGMPWQTDVPSG